MKPSVYLETTIISYLAARRSRDVIVSGLQIETHRWWDTRRKNFELVIAEPVVREASLGDPEAARRRLAFLKDIRTIPLSDEIKAFTRVLMEEAKLPRKAGVDAAHVAAATIGRADYLLTWNCSHIANAVFRPRIESSCRKHGYHPPTICIPTQLM